MADFNAYLIFILLVLVGSYFLDLIVEILNLRKLSPKLPEEFTDYYDTEKYAKSQNYTRERTKFGLFKGTVDVFVIVVFIIIGGFNWMDNIVREFGHGPIITGLIFAGLLWFGSFIINLPFSIYSTYVIEEKFGFNKTSPKTFVMDILKSILLTLLIGAPILALIYWFFMETGDLAWLYVWAAITVIQIIMMYIAPVVIFPMFNKFTPLDEGELREEIEDYAGKQNFKLKGVYKIDGSKRSTKSNAYFTGFGKSKRIALYDTLIEKHAIPELVAILAHETGHYKLGHVPKNLLISILSTGIMLFILNIFIGNRGLFDAFGMEHVSVYAGLVFFSFLYAPISMLIGIAAAALSRKYEYQADAFAVKTTNDAESYIEALKKLSVHNLSNLTPHKLKVFLEYGHPPVLQRIQAVRNLKH